MRDLLLMVPENVLEKIGNDIGVDKPNQQLTGALIYKLLLYTLAKTNRLSLRIMEFIYESTIFQKMVNVVKPKTRHSSLADRLNKINADYFSEIFSYLADKYKSQFVQKDAKIIRKFDSTLISLSSKLFTVGMNYNGNAGSLKNKLFLKITIGMNGQIPDIVKFYTDQAAASEDIALKQTIREASIQKGDFVIFDRGLAAGKTFAEFSENDITFITRVNPGRKVKILETMESSDEATGRRSETLIILNDQKVLLNKAKTKTFFKVEFRLIKAKSLKTNEDMWFLTNDFATDAIDITELYRRRWEIEVFFRFIKQELNFKHFLSRTLNGLKSYLYMVLILSILLLIYKISNNRSGYKIVKMHFTHELENEIIAEIVQCCGGSVQIFRERYCSETKEV